MKTKIKTATLGYTLQPLNRKSDLPVKYKSLFHFWQYNLFQAFLWCVKVINSERWKILVAKNGNKVNNSIEFQKNLRQANEYRHKSTQQILLQHKFGNKNPYNEKSTQMFINELRTNKI